MANTFTTNYNLVKSEIGANNDRWGQDLNDGLSAIDGQIVRKLDKSDVKSATSTQISFSGNTISGDATNAPTIFQNFQVGDVISISGATNNANNGNHTITSKTNGYTIVCSNSTFTTEASDGSSPTIAYHLVPRIDEITVNGGNIDNTAIGANTASTGKFTSIDASGEIDAQGDIKLKTIESNAEVTKATIASATGAITTKGDLTVETSDGTDKFTVDSATGNTVVKGSINADGGIVVPSGQSITMQSGSTFSGNITGNASGSASSASEATKLSTGRTIGMTGDVTYTSPSFDGTQNVTATATIGNEKVTYAKMQKVATANRVLGSTSANGVITELSGTQVGAMIPNATTSSAGLMSSADKTALDSGLSGAGFIKFKFRQQWNYGAFASSPRTYFPANPSNSGQFGYYNITDSIDLLPSGTAEIQHIHFHITGEIENNGGENPKCKFYVFAGDSAITGSTTRYSSIGDVNGTNGGVFNASSGTVYQMQASRSSTDNKFTFHMSGTYRQLTSTSSYGGRYFYVVGAMASGNQVFTNGYDTHITVYTETS